MSESPAATIQHGPKHQYHLVDPSPWPLVGAVCAGALAVGGVLYMHGHGTLLLIVAFVAVLAMMAAWWRDVIKEATFQGHHSPVVQIGMRYGMALFIASEVIPPRVDESIACQNVLPRRSSPPYHNAPPSSAAIEPYSTAFCTLRFQIPL